MIEKDELLELYAIVTGASTGEVEKHLRKIDVNKSNKIDFSEFLLAMSDDSLLHNKAYLEEAFYFFDKDHTGYIEKNELVDCLGGCEEEDIFLLLSMIDGDGDGKISLQ